MDNNSPTTVHANHDTDELVLWLEYISKDNLIGAAIDGDDKILVNILFLKIILVMEFNYCFF